MKDILVSVDDSDGCKKRLAVAQNIATRFSSHVTGIHVNPLLPSMEFYAGTYGALTIQSLQSQINEEREKVTELFYSAFSLGEGKVSFFSEEKVMAYYNLAKVNDLVVVGQPDPDLPNSYHRSMVEDLVVRSSRPLLFVPYAGNHDTTGRSILGAWDNSREASRAIHDALPLLKAAEAVHVVSVNEAEKLQTELPSATVSEHLARHDVNVIAHDVIKNKVPIAETLLSVSADYGSDMMVMGGYSHSRMREVIFGGVTRKIIDSMTIPVFMSH